MLSIRVFSSRTLLLAAASFVTLPAHAQEERSERLRAELTRRAVAFVAFAPATQADQSQSIIKRLTEPRPMDVIVLPRDATPAQLIRSITALRQMRADAGDTPNRTFAFRIRTPHSRGRIAHTAGEIGRAERLLAKLQSATVAELPGVGATQWVEIYLARNQRSVVKEKKGQ